MIRHIVEKINILRHFFCFVTSLSPPSHGPLRGWGEENRGEKRVKGRTRA